MRVGQRERKEGSYEKREVNIKGLYNTHETTNHAQWPRPPTTPTNHAHLVPTGHMADVHGSLVELSEEDDSCCRAFLRVGTDEPAPRPQLKVLGRGKPGHYIIMRSS